MCIHFLRSIMHANKDHIRYFHDARVIDVGWVVTLKEGREYYGVKYQPGAAGAYGDYR